MQTVPIIVLALALLATAIGLWGLVSALALRLKMASLDRLERRYSARWARLSLAEKGQVLARLGVVPLRRPLPRSAGHDPLLEEARLNDLFLAVLITLGRDLGIRPLRAGSLPWELLDIEINWAFAKAAAQPASARPMSF